MTPDERAEAEAQLTTYFGIKTIIDDNVPDGVWGFVGDFSTLGDEDPQVVRIDK